jgi:hypothetical protein
VNDFEKLQAALDAVRKYYKENGADFALQTVLRDAGFRDPRIYQSLIKYGLARHQPPSLGGGWRINMSTTLQSAILYRAIGKEPQYVRDELYTYLRGLESAASSADSQ